MTSSFVIQLASQQEVKCHSSANHKREHKSATTFCLITRVIHFDRSLHSSEQRTDRSDVSGQIHLRMTIKIEGEEQNMASYHIQYQILHETLFNHLCEVNCGVNIPPGTRKLKGDELDVGLLSSLKFIVNMSHVQSYD